MKLPFLFAFFGLIVINCLAQESVYRHTGVNSSFAKTYDPRSDTVDILKYTINLDITDFSGKKISGNTILKFHPKVNGFRYLRIDLLKLTVDSILIGNTKLNYHYNDTLISINLNNTFQISDTVNLTVYYHGTPQVDATGWGGFYFQNGIAYNLGVGFGANPHVYGRVWFPCLDNFKERSLYTFNITTNAGKIAYCNGELTNDVTNINNSRTRTWELDKEIPSYLASVAVGNYVDLKMDFSGEQRNIPILIAANASDTTKVKASLIHLKDAIRTYEKFYGPYAWNRVGYALVPFNQGAMEHATNIAFPNSFLNGSTTYEEIAAHELSHHWFGDYITCSSQEEMWINEGWASFSEYLFREEVYGKTAYINGIKTLHESLLHFVRYKEGDLNLNDIPHEYTYGDHVYLKGAIMAHNLRGYLGDSLFKSTIRNTLQANAFKSISNDQFQQSLSQNSGVDLSHFFEDWIYQPGWAHFSIDSFIVSKVNLQYHVKVYVRQMKYGNTNFHTNVPMDISFIDKNFNILNKKIMLSGEYSLLEMDITNNPAMVVLNMFDRISQAISSEQKVIKNTGAINFTLGKMNLTVASVSDSALIRIEHHYTGPKGNYATNINRISPQRYWTVSGVTAGDFNANAKFSYDGRVGVFSGNTYLDHQLNINNEDSLLLLYRKSPADIWQEYAFYTKNTLSSKTDKQGNLVIDNLTMGEYCLGMGTSLNVGIKESKKNDTKSLTIFPNPASKSIEIKLIQHQRDEISKISILTSTGSTIFSMDKQSFGEQLLIDISSLVPGSYLVSVELNNQKTLTKPFLVNR